MAPHERLRAADAGGERDRGGGEGGRRGAEGLSGAGRGEEEERSPLGLGSVPLSRGCRDPELV